MDTVKIEIEIPVGRYVDIYTCRKAYENNEIYTAVIYGKIIGEDPLPPSERIIRDKEKEGI